MHARTHARTRTPPAGATRCAALLFAFANETMLAAAARDCARVTHSAAETVSAAEFIMRVAWWIVHARESVYAAIGQVGGLNNRHSTGTQR